MTAGDRIRFRHETKGVMAATVLYEVSDHAPQHVLATNYVVVSVSAAECARAGFRQRERRIREHGYVRWLHKGRIVAPKPHIRARATAQQVSPSDFSVVAKREATSC